MRSQWECLLQNLGEWQGSFTQFSLQGKLIEDVPTVVSFEILNDNQTMRQIVRRLPPNQPIQEKVLEYSSLGRQVLFFDSGAFSQGSIQLSPFSEFGAEQGLIRQFKFEVHHCLMYENRIPRKEFDSQVIFSVDY